jgi:hypothetical protein
MTDKRPFWREPMVWLVAGLPFASIVASIILITVAIRTGGADTVTDDVKRVAQIQTTDLGPDQLAAERDLSAVFRVDDKGVEVIRVTGGFNPKGTLQLKLLHPSQAEQDKVLSLPPGGLGWRLDGIQVDPSHDWKVELASLDEHWRIKGRLPKQELAARLGPALKDAPKP